MVELDGGEQLANPLLGRIEAVDLGENSRFSSAERSG